MVTSYQFQCCGNITAWQTYVDPAGPRENEDRVYTIIFQVWRPAVENVAEEGCYAMVDEDNYKNIPLSRRGLVTRNLEPVDHLSVQPGDVVGYFMSHSSRDNRVGGIQFDDDGEERVWYFTNTATDPIMGGSSTSCLFTVGTGQQISSFTTAAPILDVQIGM